MNFVLSLLILLPSICWADGFSSKMFSPQDSTDLPKKMIIVEAFDANSRQTLQSFILDFTSCGFKVYESDEAGQFSMNAPDSFACFVQISKPGYARTDLLIDVNELSTDQKIFKVYLAKSSNIHTLQVRDGIRKNRYIQEAQVRFKSLLDDNVQDVVTGTGGKFEVLCEPEHRYVLEVKHPRYSTYRGIVEADKDGNFSLGDVFLQPINHPKNDQSRWTSGKIVDHRNGSKAIPHFSLQIGATSNPLYDLTTHQVNLKKFGKVFLQPHDNIYRIKVGRYYTRDQAEAAIKDLQQLEGYDKAYITQTIVEQVDEVEDVEVQEMENEIMVRLASYQNPDFFDREKIAHLGQIDLLAKEEWKIAVIRGFTEVAAAEAALKTARELGFTQAYLVEDKAGVLRRVTTP